MNFFNSRKAAFAPAMTVIIIVFSIFYWILIYSFATDELAVAYGEQNIGTARDARISLTRQNTSEDSSHVNYADRSWISQFFIGINGMPWWIIPFSVLLQGALITITILAWIRGL